MDAALNEHFLQNRKEDVVESALISQGLQIALLTRTIFVQQELRKVGLLHGCQQQLPQLSELCWTLTQLHSGGWLSSLGNGLCKDSIFGTTIADDSIEAILDVLAQQVSRAQEALAPLPQGCLVQGLAAVIPGEVRAWILTGKGRKGALSFLQAYFCEMARQSDPEVRLASLKGIRTLCSRSITLLDSGNSPHHPDVVAIMQSATDTFLEIVLQAWENPPNRKMGNALPSVFQSIVDWKDMLANQQQQPRLAASGLSLPSPLDPLVDRLLGQPPYRKGKYAALECLLPKVGSQRMLIQKTGENHSTLLLSDLLRGIGDIGHNTGAITDLLAKLLQSLFREVHNLNHPYASPQRNSL